MPLSCSVYAFVSDNMPDPVVPAAPRSRRRVAVPRGHPQRFIIAVPSAPPRAFASVIRFSSFLHSFCVRLLTAIATNQYARFVGVYGPRAPPEGVACWLMGWCRGCWVLLRCFIFVFRSSVALSCAACICITSSKDSVYKQERKTRFWRRMRSAYATRITQ